MKAGETVRCDCDDCHAEFEVCFEPKAKGDPKSAKTIRPVKTLYCPFCGSEAVTSDED